MARPGYMSIYADERTQGIFDEFCRIKGITKSTALTEMLDILQAKLKYIYLTHCHGDHIGGVQE